ncbi:S-layer homology domain-containing protein [Dysosmobacter sp.]|uniref:S-layer homology domain-containing protein n=1 Tax=Dysosmobacter sp. TaxID=2591382 RepID=UPI003AAD3B33
MKRRISSTLMALVLCLTLLPAAAYADGGTAVYVSSSGSDDNAGTQTAPYATLAKAVTEAEDGSTIYVMSNLTMTKCARYYDKDLTITSLDPNNPVTISRGTEFDPQSDHARSWYNPAMIEVQTRDDKPAGLTLTNIIFDDDGKKEGTVFAQAVSDGSIDNKTCVQDAIIASNATVPSTITLGDGAVLRNFGGMSAVRVTDQAKLVMKSGSVIEDASSITRSKGDAGSVGPAGAVWLQGGSLEMENGAEIRNINGRAVYADGGSVSVGGTISGITGNPAMWQGEDGTAIHLRNKASGTLLSGGIIKEISGTKSSSAVYVHTSTLNCNEESKICNCDSVGILSVYCDSNWNKGRNIVNFDGELSGTLNNKNPFQIACTNLTIGKNAKIHGNSAYYGALYLQKNVTADIYGKIYENTASGRGGGIGTAGHGFVEINLYKGAEIKDNIANNTGGGLSLKNAKFVMHGGKISGNRSNNNVGGGVYLYKDVVVELHGGTISGNIDKNGSNDITITDSRNSTSENNYLAISNDITIGNKAIYFEKDTKTVTPAADSLDIKLGNASPTSVAALSGKANANGWSAPLATFWAQRDGAAELTVGGLTLDSALPQIVYALVQETNADGKPVSGAEIKVYSTEITTDGIRLTLPNGYANGCAVALAQPTTDFGSVFITGPAEIAESYGAVTYEVPYTATYTMSNNLLSMLQHAPHGVPMTFVVELDSRLTAKKGADGKFLYDFDGAGILEVDESSITVSPDGHTITVVCNPVTTDWTNAVKNKTSVIMTLKGTGVLAATGFDAGKYLNTTGHIEGAISVSGTPLPIMIPANVCQTKMTAHYSVFYHGNEADSGETVDSRSYIFGDLAVVSENGYVRDGHSFVGWNTQRDGSGTHHVPGSSITVTDHIHLYAQWTRNSSGDDDDTGYTLRLTKLDAGDGTPLSGAKFELWRVGARSDTRLGVYETNRYGWTQAEVSQSGDYYWVETVPPEGYRLDGGKHPTDTAKNSRITVYNAEAAVPALFTDDHYAYIVGGPDGTVRPNDSMTRAGVATIFFRLLKDSVRDANLLTGCTYTDVPDGHWANTAISTMTGLDIVRGYDAAAFGPGDPITRAQFAAICARFDTGKSNGSRTFSDIEGHWAKAYIERAAELGWISGFQDGTFRPDAYITRAQAVTMINRMLNRVPEDPSDLLPGMNVWPDCNPGDWFYLAIQEATNSHDFEHKAGNYETWTKLMKNPDWTRYEN